ncbi:hypothetical protein ACFRR6_02110 [Streptomyces sp. NPDC056891]|uniref:hypothetical protein n=1 Tax=Streptomyces sp. NPDC056891 TaxID=3345961 RepID=UPI0036752BB8
MTRTSLRRSRASRVVTVGAAVAACLTLASACNGPSGRAQPTPAPPGSSAPAAPVGVVTVAEANAILDNYQDVNNRANASQDADLISSVEAGQLYAQSKAQYEQYGTLGEKEKQEYKKPFYFTERNFYIPEGGNWFAAQAVTEGTSRQLLVFEKSADTANTWKKVAATFPEKSMPPIETRQGLALTADAGTAVGPLAPRTAAAAVEDLFATGGTREGAQLSHENESAKSILKKYAERGSNLGPQAQVSFRPVPPGSGKIYALRTGSGVIAIVPLAHTQESRVTDPSLLITPGTDERVYNATSRSVVVSTFQGTGVVLLSSTGPATLLDYRYELTGSR